jgi:FkbM family methyltransferase
MRLFGFDIQKSPSQADFLRSRNINLVLDVGANQGQYAQELRSQGYTGRIFSFEPTSGPFESLSRRAARDPDWQVFKSAVGAVAGTAEIHITKNSVYSSIRSQTSMISDFSKKSAIIGKETVPVMRLDDLALAADDRIFLKVDTQGFEQEVLAGAAALLTKCLGVQLELPVEHLYDGVWSFSEAVLFMDRLGFVPAQFRMVNPLHDDPVSGIEFDCIFRRKRPEPGSDATEVKA